MARQRRLTFTIYWGISIILYAFVQSSSEQTTKIPSTTTPSASIPSTSIPSTMPRSTVLTPTMTSREEEKFTTAMTPNEQHFVPLNEGERNCTPPAIEQFPRPLISPSSRKHGAIIIHVLVCIYSFIGLAIVCDDYFVTSLDRICEVLKLSPDVAGATFMAAGSSAPELATVVIAVFFAKDDIGVSGVIGSAVFNIMFVIGICALFGGTVSYLNWWPLCRDSFFYLLSILVMLIVIFDDLITWGESFFMLLMYIAYCTVLAFNKPLEKWAQTLPVPCKNIHHETLGGNYQQPQQPVQQGLNEQQQLVSYKTLDDKEGYSTTRQDGGFSNVANGESGVVQMHDVGPSHMNGQNKPEYYRAKEPTTTQVSPLLKPETDDRMTLIQWHLCYPIHYTAQATMPDCRLEKYANWYPFTFLVSMIWISFYSYIMVWMITIIGSTLGIPDTVMGLTFVAAGVSVPDALSSLAVVKEGYGDMAVSNAVGSNVFDILICLGLPWFIKTAIIKPGSYVKVFSKGLTYSTLTLLSTVVFLVGITHLNGWKMDKRYGITLILWYIFFICFASLYELNVFGNMNPPECSTDY
ncbi:probable sodium/potassium/calcium exchanger CG1090 [Cimex lectularius]|uniref:Sodium/calcium exchanger membrane region domain-containing protein n=1 Tax=Cimex lectularius TaxID=79782 RepID=A0A8I6RXV5_CIMLE|nr:probable sodium/potassium/calcium exchanger CG1090 [Cimex lectularius]XP_014254465.1 probable sodium/potassium/calcium exchanger CG1090 [Cimex lectularius]